VIDSFNSSPYAELGIRDIFCSVGLYPVPGRFLKIIEEIALFSFFKLGIIRASSWPQPQGHMFLACP